MTPEEREKMFAVCKLIVDEKDPKKFSYLVEEFNKLLDQKNERIQPQSASTRQPKKLRASDTTA
jgi:hypothetical protein